MGAPDFKVTMGLAGAGMVATGIDSIINIVQRLTAVIAENARAVHEYSSVIRGHRVDVEEADRATKGLIDTVEIHRGAATLEAAGIELTSNQLRSLSVAAATFAQRTGQDITDVFTRMYTAIRSAESEGLKPFGIELRGTATLAERQRASLEMLTREFGNQEVQVRDTYEAISQLQNVWGTAWSEMLLTMQDEGSLITEIITGVTSALTDLTNALQTQRRAREHMARMGTVTEQLEIQRQLRGMGYTATGERGEGWSSTSARFLSSFPAGIRAIGRGRGMEGGLAELDREAHDLAGRLAMLEDLDLRGLAEGEPVVRDDPNAITQRLAQTRELGGGGGGGGRNRESHTQRQERLTDELIAGVLEEAQMRKDIETETNDFLISEEERLYGEKRRIHEQYLEEQEQFNERTRQLHDQYAEDSQRILDFETEIWRSRSDALEKHISSAETWAQTIGTIYGQFTQAVGGLAGALAKNAEEEKRIQGGIYIAEQVGALLLATTMAAINYAAERWDQAALYTVAIGVAAAGLAKTCIEFGQTSKSGAGGSGGAMARPESRGSRGGMSNGEQIAYVYNINGVVAGRGAAEEIQRLERDAARAY